MDPSSRWKVRSPTEVHELPLPVERDPLLGDLAHQFELVHLVLLGEERFCLGARQPHPPDGEIVLDDPLHLRLDLRQVVAVHRLREPDVVVEPTLDRRTDGKLRPGVEPGHGMCKDVGCRVTEYLERRWVVQADRAGFPRIGQGIPQVLELPVHEDYGGRLSPLLKDREDIAVVDFDRLAAGQDHVGHPTPPVVKRMSRTLPRSCVPDKTSPS